MEKKNLFGIYAILGMVITIICGFDSLFENPLGLIAFSAIFGIVLAGFCVGVLAVAENISPKQTKKLMENLLSEE